MNISWGLVDTVTITKRNLRRYLRLPQLVFFSSIQPIMFLVLFNFVFGGAIGLAAGVPGGKYINFLLPGILVQTIMFGGVQTGIGLAEDMGKGIMDRFRSLPMSRLAVLAGRTLSDTVRNLVVTAIMITVGFILGFRFQNGFFGAIGMVALTVTFGYAISWVFAFIGMKVKDAETAQLATFLFIFPLTFASAAYVPIETMPSWLQAFANHQPVTQVVNAGRYLALGAGSVSSVWRSIFWIIGIMIVFVPLSIREYKRMA
ncbi:MAG TPA: ABC transporter permease [Candidatus Saccharimonadales bacterium]|nr:ABC transporter permease [Candidatus Saccharimonadales bacterium]